MLCLVTIVKHSLKATGHHELRIKDAYILREVDLKKHMARASWENKYATYSGDSRGLTNMDQALISNLNNQEPGPDEVFDNLYHNVYSQRKNSIENLVKTTK